MHKLIFNISKLFLIGLIIRHLLSFNYNEYISFLELFIFGWNIIPFTLENEVTPNLNNNSILLMNNEESCKNISRSTYEKLLAEYYRDKGVYEKINHNLRVFETLFREFLEQDPYYKTLKDKDINSLIIKISMSLLDNSRTGAYTT